MAPIPPVLSPVELYDLAQDPEEKHNIVDERSPSANQIILEIDRIIRSARKRNTEKLEIDQELRKQLKALGYIR